MKIFFTISLLFFGFISTAQKVNVEKQDLETNQKVGFVANRGQIIDQEGLPNNAVLYLLNLRGLNVQLRKNGFSYDTYVREGNRQPRTLHSDRSDVRDEKVTYKFHRVDVEFVGANNSKQLISEALLPGQLNHYSKTGALTTSSAYEKITYQNLYQGIDLVFKVNQTCADDEPKVEYDFVVHPGADPSDIKLSFNGQRELSLKDSETLVFELQHGDFTESIPLSFEAETNKTIQVGYHLDDSGEVSFNVESYDKCQTLIIDPTPTQVWSTYFGGSLEDAAYAVVQDAAGNIYVTGYAESTGLATSGAHQLAVNVPYDAFVMKLGQGGSVIWATYYGGEDNDYAYDIAVDASSNVFVAGETYSCAGISTTGAHQETCNTNTFYDAFLVKFNSSGVRQFGTYYAGDGSDAFTSVDVDATGNIYLTGVTDSPNNISTASSHQVALSGAQDAFIVKFDNGGVRQWGSYYGGTLDDYGKEVTTDGSGNVYIVGRTFSTTNIFGGSAHQSALGGNKDGFVAKFNSSGVRQWGSYYGGPDDDQVSTIKVHTNGDVYLSGFSYSVSGISTSGSYQPAIAGTGSYDAFLTKLNLSGIRQWGTYFGGANGDEAYGITLDGVGDGYLVGNTLSSTGFASSGAFQTTYGGGTNGDGFIAKFTAGGSFSWATYLGGSGDEYAEQVSLNGTSLVVAGSTSSTSGVSTFGSFQSAYGGGNYDAMIAKFDVSTGPVVASFNPTSGTVGTTITITGSNFSATPANNTVKFNGTTAVVSASTATSMTTTVPSGATTGTISVTVASVTGTSSSVFTVTTASTPTIASFNPTSGPVGTSITITGTNFSATPASNIVKFNGITAVVTLSSATSITTTVPTGATSGIISVTVAGQTGISSSNFTVTSTVPGISSFNPITGPVGTSVTISGVNFSATPANNAVKFNGTTAVVTASTATSITTSVPVGATTGPISVTVGGQTGTSSSDFTVTTVTAPTITSFNPTSGIVGTSVIITGTNFDALPANNIVKFNGVSSTVTASSVTSITTTVPTGATTGPITVTVGTLTGTSSTNFTVTTSTSSGEPTNSPTALIFTSVTATTYSFSFTAAAAGTVAPDGYIGLRKAGSAPTSVPVDGTNYIAGDAFGDGFINFIGTGTAYNQTSGTLPSTTYYHVIYSYKGTGSAINYKQVSPLTNFVTTAADDTPPVFSANTTPASVKTGETVKVSLTVKDDESGITSVLMNYGESSSFDWTQLDVPLVKTSGNVWEFTIPAATVKDQGIEYIITATNGAGGTADTGILGVSITVDQNGFTVPFAGAGTSQSNYKIVSVPLALESKTVNSVFGDDLGNYGNKSKWRLFRYSGGKTNEFSGSSSINPGEGYWFISSDNTSIDSGPGKTVGRISAPYTISVTQGFNQIGNPYVYNLLWADVKTYSYDVNDNTTLGLGNLRTFTGGSWSDGTILKKYEGGFVMATTAGTLVFPAEKKAAAGRVADPPVAPVQNTIDNSDWEVNFELSNGIQTMNFSGIGMNKKASDQYDSFDDFTLPRFMDYIELNHVSKELFNLSYTKDIVPTAENHTWEFNVESNTNELVTMKWDNSFFGNNNKQLVLWDVTQQRGFNMRSISQYIFNKSRSGHFKIYYGDEQYVKERTAVEQLVYHDVFPNPATDQVTISFSLPTEDQVTIEVIDLLGRKVATIADGNFTKGYHEVKWNAKDDSGSALTNGIYITQIKSLNSNLQKRLSISK